MAEPHDASRFLPWILGGIAAIVGALWAALQSGRAKEIARLEAALAHEQTERARERQEHDDQLERLGERLDAVAEARASDQRKMTRLLLAARQEPASAQQWEEEAPTGVRRMLDLMPGSRPDPELDAMLSGFNPNESTPPKLKPPRPRMPSRPK